MVDVIMCAIFSECRLVKGCGCGEKFQFALSHWLEVSPYNTAYITVWQCDYLPPTKEEVYVFARAPELVCLSVCLSVQNYSKTRAWIWMKCCVSTNWTNWLPFEPYPDHRPDPGTGFTPDFFLILARYLNKLWADFDKKFYGSTAAGVCTIWLHFEPHANQSPDFGSGHVFKIARWIALNVMEGFQWNCMDWMKGWIAYKMKDCV